jgi:long-chain fatty acid transport protein
MLKKCALLTTVIIFAAASAWASGFRIPEQSAAAMGMANAWVAQADDPSAIVMNPAGIVNLDKADVSGGFLIITPGIKHTDVNGKKYESEDNVFFPPNMYGTCKMGTDKWAFGLGVSVPFGLGTEWTRDSFARYSSTLTQIELFNVNPTLAYKINKNFSIGAGIDYYHSTVTLKQQVPWGLISFAATGNPALLGTPDGGFNMVGTGDGWGYNVGLLYKGDVLSAGLTYRSQVLVDYSGKA